jgi:colicin import membrane protein
MARPGITYEDVDAVATALLQQGKNPTQLRIMQTLGQGSATTINKYYKIWRERRAQLAETNATFFPPVGTEKVVSQVWEKLTTEAQEKFKQLKEESESKVSILNETNQQLIQEKEASNQALEKANQKINHLEMDIQLLKKELAQERQHCEVETMRANKAEELVATLQTETQSHIVNLKQAYETHLAELREQCEKERGDFRTDLTQYRDLLEDQRVKFMVKLDEYKTSSEQAIKQLAQSEVEFKRQCELAEGWMEKVRALEVDLTIAKEQINTLARKK